VSAASNIRPPHYTRCKILREILVAPSANARGLLGNDVDEMQWGVADHWSDPFETLLSNRGDCEDYAILKYTALLEAGVPKGDVKIVILKNFFPSETHAAVATRVDGQRLILDNRTLTLVRDTDVTRAIPEFVLDHEGVKRFTWASQNRRVGS
jgi:predicted transglutaminase-like cysteine proteinase